MNDDAAETGHRTDAPLVPRIVDAHMHVWDLSLNRHPWLCDDPVPFRYGDYSSICRTYLFDDYRRDSYPLDVVATVYVEAEWNPRDPLGEMRWIHDIAERGGRPNAVVAQAWLDREDASEVLAGVIAFPLVRSIRHKPASAPSFAAARRGLPGSMDDRRWRDGYALLGSHGLMFELQAPWWHLDAACDLARDFPKTTIVLNHTGLPADRSAEGLAAWRDAMAALAEEPNVAVKISGLGVRGARWSAAANATIVRDTIAMFGADRCLFASNFPVDSVVGDFRDIFEGFSAVTAGLPPKTRRALFHDNAAALYRIRVDDDAVREPKNETGGRS